MNVFVYLITDGKSTKVGISDNPQARLKEIQTGNPNILQLRHVYTCHDRASASWVEKLIHKRYSQYKAFGEWFNISPDIIIQDIAWALDIATGIATINADIPKTKRPPKTKYRTSSYTRVDNATEKIKAYFESNPEHKKLSVRELAKIIGVGKSTINRVMNED